MEESPVRCDCLWKGSKGKVKGSDGLQRYTGTDTSRNLGLAAPDEKPPTGQRLSGQPGQQPVVPQNGHAVSREILTQRNTQPPLQGGHWPSVLPAPDSTEATASWTHRTTLPATAQAGPETKGFISPRTWLPVYQLQEEQVFLSFHVTFE